MFDEEKKDGASAEDLKALQAKIDELQAQVGAMSKDAAKPPVTDAKANAAAKTEAAAFENAAEVPADEPVYETMFGDRRRLKKGTSKKFGILFGVLAVLLVAGYAIFMVPVGFKTPGFADLTAFTKEYGQVWTDEENYFAVLVKPENAEATQSHVVHSAEKKLYANVFCYKFGSATDAKAYMEGRYEETKTYLADEQKGAPQSRTLLSGAIIGEYAYENEADGYGYVAWFKDNMLVEIYASQKVFGEAAKPDDVIANWVRQTLNRVY